MGLEERYRGWIERYMRAWESNEESEIAELFTTDALYYTEPYAEPWRGRDEIVKRWLERRDQPGEWTFTFKIASATKQLGIIRGHASYSQKGLEYENLWEVTLSGDDRCSRFVEWWMKEPTTAEQDG